VTIRDTIPSRALTVWRRLYTRYALEPFPATVSPDVSKTIQPITDADELLRIPAVDITTTPSLTLGEQVGRTVPTPQRWKLYAWDVNRASGDRLVEGISLGDGTVSMRIASQTAAGTFIDRLGTPLLMDPGWQFILHIAGGTTDGTWLVELLLQIEDAF